MPKVKLVADALKAKVIFNLAKQTTVEEKRLFASLKRNGIPPESLVLAEIHPWAHRFINDILDHGKADVRECQKHISRPEEIFILEDFGTCVSYEPQGLRKQVCRNLWETHHV